MNLARLKTLNRATWFLLAGGLLALILLGLWLGSSALARPAVYQTTPVTRGNLTASVGATGAVRAAQSASLSWQTNGRVEQVNVAIGAEVAPDQVLATLAQDSLPAQIVLAEADRVTAQRDLDNLTQSNIKVAEAMQKLADARQTVKDAQDKVDFYAGGALYGRVPGQVVEDVSDQIKQAQTQLKFTEWIYNRYYRNTDDALRRKAEMNLNLANSRSNLNSLLAKYNWYTGKPSEIQMEQLQSALNLAKAQEADAQRELDRLNDGQNVDDLIAARAKVAAAQSALNLSKVIAPFRGVVTQAQSLPGDQVTPGLAAFQVDDLSHLLIDLQVSEVDINTVAVGQRVTITFDAVQGKTYQGLVEKVNLSGNQNQGAVDFAVTISLVDADEFVLPGMTAAVTITIKESQNVLLIPSRAVRVVNGQRVVYVLKADQAVPVEVRLGATADGSTEVVGGGLAEGDLIVLNPPTESAAGN
jgi:HlyD family secretion protein